MVSEARRQKLLAKRHARNRERGARAAAIAAAVIDQHDKKLLSIGLSSSDRERCMLDRRSVLVQARKQAREDLRIEKNRRQEQQALRESAFLRLPAEVRCLIYEQMFADKRIIITADSSMLDSSRWASLTTNTDAPKRRARTLKGAWALTAVCRLVRREVLQMTPAVSQLAFTFDGWGRSRMDDFDRWLSELGANRISQIRRITLVGSNLCTTYCPQDGDDVEDMNCTRTARINLDGSISFKSQCPPRPWGLPCGHTREAKMSKLLERARSSSESGQPKVLDKVLLNEVYSWLNSFVDE